MTDINLTTTNKPISTGAAGPPAEPLSPGGCGLGLGGVLREALEIKEIHTFSARTCIELLPLLTDAQIDTEVNHLRALHPDIKFRMRHPNVDAKRDLLHKTLAKSLCQEVDSIVSNFDLLFQNISRSIKVTEKHVEEVDVLLSTDVSTEDIPTLHTSNVGNTELDNPVSFSNISFSDIKYEDIERDIKFTDKLSGDRETAYYGSVGYSYNNITHELAEYPNIQVFDTLFRELQTIDPECTRENYTCLVTRYPNGNSFLNLHHDDERSIMPGTNIYTVSFGATRSVKFSNVKGRLNEQYFKLEHGSVHCMTKESQSIWRHGIIREPEVTGSRISFTFRRLINTPQEVKQDIVPPISPHTAPDTTDSTPTRVLFLTDSVLSSTPTYVFDTIPNHVCIKKVNFKLTDIHNFRDEFSYTDVVIVSCGINDLSRYGHTANSLADVVCNRLKLYSAQYPNTKFIYNSILLTRDHKWLNNEVNMFNRYMFELSRSTRNLFFFNSDGLVAQSDIKRIYHPNSNGIHVSLDVKKLITRELVNSVGFIAGSRGARFQRCGWLRHVTTRSSWAG